MIGNIVSAITGTTNQTATAPQTKAQIEAAEDAAKAAEEAAEAAAKADKELQESLAKAVEDAQKAAEEAAEDALKAQEEFAEEMAESKVDLEKQAELQEKLVLATTAQTQASESLLLANEALAAYNEAKNPTVVTAVDNSGAGRAAEANVRMSMQAGPSAEAEPGRSRVAQFTLSIDEARAAAEMARSVAKTRQIIDGMGLRPAESSLNVMLGGAEKAPMGTAPSTSASDAPMRTGDKVPA